MDPPVLRLSRDLAHSTTLVVLAAGRGQRFGGGITPKHLASLHGVPLVVRLLGQLGVSFHESPVIVVDERDSSTARVLREWEMDVRFAVQTGGRGTVPAMLSALPYCAENVCVVLGDIFLAGHVHEVLDRVPTIAVWPAGPLQAVRANYGVALSGSAVVAVLEKPQQAHELNCGMGLYFLGADTVRSSAHAVTQDRYGEFGVTSLLAAIIATGELNAVMFEGVYTNVNRPEDLALADRLLSTL